MSEPAETLSADDLLPLARKLPRGEQLRLARGLLEPEPGTADDLLAKRRAGIGRYAGQGWIAENFDAPLPPGVPKCFDGEDDAGEGVRCPGKAGGVLAVRVSPIPPVCCACVPFRR